LDSFLALNDIKNRVDHETGGMPEDFWADVAEALNGSSEDDNSALEVVLSEEDPHYGEIMQLDLEDFDIMTSSAIRKKFNMLLKVRKVMEKNMTQSGEHDNNAYNFVDLAMERVGGTGLTTIGCYYFFVRCEATPEVDVCFADTMDLALMGNTESSPIEDSVLTTSSGGTTTTTIAFDKKRAYAAIVDMSNIASTIANEMKETNKIGRDTANEMKESNRLANATATAIIEKNRISKHSQLITLAQHLGKEDMLEKLLADLASGG
jgi:hypothetical protein